MHRAASVVFAYEHEATSIGHQHLPVTLPVACHLVARGGQPSVVGDGLNLDDSALGLLSGLRLALLHLLGRVQTEVGMTNALIRHLLDAEHFWLERSTHCVQQVSQRHVKRTLVGCTARCSDHL